MSNITFPYVNSVRWNLIKSSLSAPFMNKTDFLLERINKYQPIKHATIWNKYFNSLEESRQNYTVTHLLPEMASVALKLPELFPEKTISSIAKSNSEITVSKLQAASLLCNSFFCTYEKPSDSTRDVNFMNILGNAFGTECIPQCYIERLRFLMNYFERIISDKRWNENISIYLITKSTKEMPNFSNLDEPITKVEIRSGKIGGAESSGHLQVDFADKYIGGLTLRSSRQGVVSMLLQEELLFLSHPELIVTMIFHKKMNDNQAFIMIGAERFSNYTGYADKVVWDSNYNDSTERDDKNRMKNYFVAIDATPISSLIKPSADVIKRDLLKAYIGFSATNLIDVSVPIATGHWGCGAFGWNKMTKALTQILAASAAKRKIVYFVMERNSDFQNELESKIKELQDQKITCKQLYQMILNNHK